MPFLIIYIVQVEHQGRLHISIKYPDRGCSTCTKPYNHCVAPIMRLAFGAPETKQKLAEIQNYAQRVFLGVHRYSSVLCVWILEGDSGWVKATNR